MAKTILFVALILALGLTLQVKQQHSDFAKIEVGQLSAMQDDGDQWHYVALQNHFTNPVVLMQITTYNGGNPVHIRVKNVQSTSFEFKMEEWEYLDEWHTDENINFVVAEKGTYNLACGNQMEVGTVGDVMEDFIIAHFQTAFPNLPVLHTQCQTHNGGHAVVTRTKEISNVGFQVKLKEQEAYGEHPNAEVIGYFAIQAGSCGPIAADITTESYNHNWQAINFANNFDNEPITFVNIQSHNGGNTAGIRMKNLSGNNVDVMIEEEQSNDDEMNHLDEVLGYLVIEAPQVTKLELTKHCISPEVGPECEGEWDCAYIKSITQDLFAMYNTNGDLGINLNDVDADPEHVQFFVAECDQNQDGVVCEYELFDCIVRVENDWRAAMCDPYVELVCQNPFIPCQCDWNYSCDFIYDAAAQFMVEHDVNGDGVYTYSDVDSANGNYETLELVIDLCDLNDDQMTCEAEIRACMAMIVDEGRIAECPNFPLTDCGFEGHCDICPDMWDCDDIQNATEEVMAYYDTDNNGFINPADDIESEHWEDFLMYCDQDDDGSLCKYEIFDCIQAVENIWRGENCEEPIIISECPNPNPPCNINCDDAWPCSMVEQVSIEVMIEMDTNGDNSINLGDEISSYHLDMLQDNCDLNGDGGICQYELFECVLAAENAYRYTYCPQAPELYCVNPFLPDDCWCEGAWTCEDVDVITQQWMNDYDANGDGFITSQDFSDDQQATHDDLMYECDENMNGDISWCELRNCVIKHENEWRAVNCENYGPLYCEDIERECECEGAWFCEDIDALTMDIMAMYDTNGDQGISIYDELEVEKQQYAMDCDQNFDNSLSACEIFECLLIVENEWREVNCPFYPPEECETPDYENCECIGEWGCDDIENITYDFFAAYDTNGDNLVNYADNMSAEDLQLALDYCDLNGDIELTKCEVFDCLLEYENNWRVENCGENYPTIDCVNPIPESECIECIGKMTCDEINELSWDIFNYYNSDDVEGINYINNADEIDQEHLSIMLDYCDRDGDGQICVGELFECLEKEENAWREENCPEYPFLNCDLWYKEQTCYDCTGIWTCDEIEYHAETFLAYHDSNSDYNINPQDNIEPEHYELLLAECDTNFDGTISACEIHACVQETENAWREENVDIELCGYATCPCPWPVCECIGAMNCLDIFEETYYVMEYMDVNADGQINLGDDIDPAVAAQINEMCDNIQQNGQIDSYEVQQCLVMIENTWRQEYCPNCEALYCQLPPEEPCTCNGAWHCNDIDAITDEILVYYDVNGDGALDVQDQIDPDHWVMIESQCDINGDCTVDACELHTCVEMIENEWRDAYCPTCYGYVYCNCPYVIPECAQALTCEQILAVTLDTMAYYDSNFDNAINPIDMVDQEDLQLLVEYCDEDVDGSIDECELQNCIVMQEQAWQDENCPDYPQVCCPCEQPTQCQNFNCVGALVTAQEAWQTMDTNMDGQINLGDGIASAQSVDLLIEECDTDMDGAVDECEFFQCIVMAENRWRNQNCPLEDLEHLFCPTPMEPCPTCPGMWTCEDMAVITEEVFFELNQSNDDEVITLDDQLEQEHFDELVFNCDMNNDGQVDKCEMFQCIVQTENEWREIECPGYAYAYCETPFDCVQCNGAWSCADIEAIAYADLAYYDSNGDGVFNPEDAIDADHYALMVAECDTDFDGTLTYCEIHACIVIIENEWRAANCDIAYGEAVCPIDECPTPTPCEGAWNCEDIAANVVFAMENYDTNGDGSINLGDEIDTEHFELALSECDLNNDGSLCALEIQTCLINTENEWRAENCPLAEQLWCPLLEAGCPTCPGMWTCENIADITTEIYMSLDANGDGMINLGDLEPEHLDELNMYCDFNGDNQVEGCEIHECVLMIENDWRSQHCPNYGYAYCETNIPCTECEGCWSCEDVATNVECVISYYDSNLDGAINPEDVISEEKYQEFLLCDGDMDGSISACELFECAVIVENEWRADQGQPDLYCDPCPFADPECPGAWNCVDIIYQTEYFYEVYNTNGDSQINAGDNIDAEHLDILLENCDENQDGTLCVGEIHACIVMAENIWREEYCPADYEPLFCPEIECGECEGSMNCEQLTEMAVQTFGMLNSNGDAYINLGDNLDTEHWQVLVDTCDFDADENIDACEIFACLVMAENEWRADACPEYGLAYCECTIWDDCPECVGHWSCSDIDDITELLFDYYNTDGDSAIDVEDTIEDEHLALMGEYCDQNNDGSLFKCEVHDCLNWIENEWRDLYCEDCFGNSYCECHFPTPECEGAWNCDDIQEHLSQIMATMDTNQDGQLNEYDDIDQEHLDMIMGNCDGNVTGFADGQLHTCEVEQCLIDLENDWRINYCPEEYPTLSCVPHFQCPPCEGAWTCDVIAGIVADYMTNDMNGDGLINLGDELEGEHFNGLLEFCDINGDAELTECEIHECLVNYENDWRDANCPEYGHVFCYWDNSECLCEGAWGCPQIDAMTYEIIAYYDTNNDGVINPEDNVDAYHLAEITAVCDSNFDGTTNFCEIYECLVIMENQYRADYCPNYGEVVCNCEVPEPPCDGAWNCLDVQSITYDVFACLDTNNDNNINLGDEIDSEHLDLIYDYCDNNGDDTINECEIFDCIVLIENEWRHEYCPESEDLWCQVNPFNCVYCEGAWNCEEVHDAATQAMWSLDTNNDDNINLGDDISAEEFQMLIDNCDVNGDESITECEFFQCAVEVENLWRQDNCPEGYGFIYCECTFPQETCNDMSLVWTCADIDTMISDIMAAYDQNGDNHLNPEDTDMDPEMYELFVESCDFNNDGSVSTCEVQMCLVGIENDWRAENCTADFGMLYCPCDIDVCEGEWSCDDIEFIANEMFQQADTNFDNQINAGDEHADFIHECDLNDDGIIDQCEMFECVINIENEWRAEYCPSGYEMVWCNCPFVDPECPGAWTCEHIYTIAEEVIAMDANGDGNLDQYDNIDYDHFTLLAEGCDQNGDEILTKCEIHDCIVMMENAYRTENCPGYSMAYCENPYFCVECENAWDCEMIEQVTAEAIAYYDTNNDNAINPEDYIDDEHYGTLLEGCDFNFDGTVDECEMKHCVLMVENAWREENCPAEYGALYCGECYIAPCDGAWNCLDIVIITDEVFYALDTNNDAQLNEGDMIDTEHLTILLDYCDADGNGQLNTCEVHDCVIMCENEWRAQYCPEAENLYCMNPYECDVCHGAWTCEDVYNVTAEYFYYSDTNGDGLINYGDDLSQEHLDAIMANCDFDGDESIEACEAWQCVIMIENEWRAENCPSYGDLFCDVCPFGGEQCDGLWTCSDIEEIAWAELAYLDTNGDMSINPEDLANVDQEHYNAMMELCDVDFDGSVTFCELHECIVVVENEWRLENCPEYGAAYCPCPVAAEECPGAWNCEDVFTNSEEYIQYYDTNNDGQINLGDDIDDSHLTVILESCDYDGNNQVDYCEIHQCMVDTENQWRLDNCPVGYDMIYCDCPYHDAHCDGAWYCEDIYAISVEVIAYYDTNNDGQINLGDNIDSEHLAELNMYCDFSGDGVIDACEVHECVVMIENDWRAEYCPDFGMAYCNCPFYVQECNGAWSCEQIEDVAVNVVYYYDTNMDGAINPEDNIDGDHYSWLQYYCDFNFDGTIDSCEVHQCIVNCENEYRMYNCIDTPEAYCPCPFEVPVCEGAWNCLDVAYITDDVMYYYDTNGDDNINLSDNIDTEHYDILVDYCDNNNDGNLNACEIHDCVVLCENEWRSEYCPESEDLFCACPYEVAECDGAWNCSDIEYITYDIMAAYDSNYNGAIDMGDNIEEEHYAILVDTCDMNGDGVVDSCEIFDCVVMCENEWRAENCPSYGELYCECSIEVMTCEGAWECADIYDITVEVMAYYDSNMDGTISLEDDIDPAHLEEIQMYCDYNGNGEIDACEAHACIVMIENEWRAEYCPEYPQVYCDCPFVVDTQECEGAWYCDDILEISVEVIAYYDTNNDGVISLEDDIEPTHLEEINYNCDYNGNGVTDSCEVHACIVMIENNWRDEYCPDYGHIYCECPFEVTECEGAWDCEDIYNISIEVLNMYDTNYDGSINLEDELETEHYEILTEYCDYNNDGTVDSCEVHSCIVDCENAWRDEVCPDYGHVYCDCPFYVPSCDGAWNCDDIYNISVEMINAYDTNYDGTISLADDIDPSHYDVLVEYCDTDGNGEVDSCETHACVVMIENEWRAEYCPESEMVYCDCPF